MANCIDTTKSFSAWRFGCRISDLGPHRPVPRHSTVFRVSVTVTTAGLPEKPNHPSHSFRHCGGPFLLTGPYPPGSLAVVPLIGDQRYYGETPAELRWDSRPTRCNRPGVAVACDSHTLPSPAVEMGQKRRLELEPRASWAVHFWPPRGCGGGNEEGRMKNQNS